MNGWIKVHRSLLDSPIWTSASAEGRVILITLLLSVTPVPYKSFWNGQEIVVCPGQMITSIEGICACTGLLASPQNVRTMLRKCKQAGFLTEEVTNVGRLITITNWDVYQSQGSPYNTGVNKTPTNNQQMCNMLAIINKKDEENKKVREAINACSHYQNCIGAVNNKIAEEIIMYESILEPKLVCEAIDQAVKRNAKWQYARAILERCKNSGILTLADYKASASRSRKRKKTAEELLTERGYI